MKKIISYIEGIKAKKSFDIENYSPPKLPDIVSYQSKKIEEVVKKIPNELIVNQSLIDKHRPFKGVPKGFDPFFLYGPIVLGGATVIGTIVAAVGSGASLTALSIILPIIAGVGLILSPFVYWAVKYYKSRKANIVRIKQAKARLRRDSEMPAGKFMARREELSGLEKKIKSIARKELVRLNNLKDEDERKIKINDLLRQKNKSIKFIRNELESMYILVDKLYNDINSISSEQYDYLENLFGKKSINKKRILARLEEEKSLSTGKVAEYIDEKLVEDNDIDKFRQTISKLLSRPKDLSPKEYDLLITLLDKKYVDNRVKIIEKFDNENKKGKKAAEIKNW